MNTRTDIFYDERWEGLAIFLAEVLRRVLGLPQLGWEAQEAEGGKELRCGEPSTQQEEVTP